MYKNCLCFENKKLKKTDFSDFFLPVRGCVQVGAGEHTHTHQNHLTHRTAPGPTQIRLILFHCLQTHHSGSKSWLSAAMFWQLLLTMESVTHSMLNIQIKWWKKQSTQRLLPKFLGMMMKNSSLIQFLVRTLIRTLFQLLCNLKHYNALHARLINLINF